MLFRNATGVYLIDDWPGTALDIVEPEPIEEEDERLRYVHCPMCVTQTKVLKPLELILDIFCGVCGNMVRHQWASDKSGMSSRLLF